MKSKFAFLGLVAFLFSVSGMAQKIENDDMYFNSNDRAKLKAQKASEQSYTASVKSTRKEQKEQKAFEEDANPTDSYSARNVNPEYAARTNAQSAQEDNGDYFVNNYRYNNANNFNNWNNNFGTWYANPWVASNYYNPYINSWHSPYYGSAYDVWGNPWRNPYYRSGWGTSFSYHWGSSWDYGWGMSSGYGNPYYNSWAYNPYYGYSPWGSYYGGWGSYYGGWRYPTVVVVESGNRYGPVYGKRNSRSTQVSSDGVRTGRTYRPTSNPDTGGGRPALGGRTTTETRQQDYYDRSWRNQQNNSRPTYTNPNIAPSRSSWENNTRNTWRESNSNSGGSYSPSRSSGYDAGRSSGGSSGGSRGSSGSSSGSRSSGRGH